MVFRERKGLKTEGDGRSWLPRDMAWFLREFLANLLRKFISFSTILFSVLWLLFFYSVSLVSLPFFSCLFLFYVNLALQVVPVLHFESPLSVSFSPLVHAVDNYIYIGKIRPFGMLIALPLLLHYLQRLQSCSAMLCTVQVSKQCRHMQVWF